MFIRVDLPAPFSPSRAWISPLATTRSIPSLATTPGKRLTMPRIATAGGALWLIERPFWSSLTPYPLAHCDGRGASASSGVVGRTALTAHRPTRPLEPPSSADAPRPPRRARGQGVRALRRRRDRRGGRQRVRRDRLERLQLIFVGRNRQ